jgi:2-dehydropantoate 2-reductase
MESALKIGIVGAGAIGCYLGCRLASVGADVALFGRAHFAAEVGQYGLCAVDMNGDRVVVQKDKVVFGTEPQVLADCALLICCVKSMHTADAARQIGPVVRREACVLSLQNGIRNVDVLRAGLGGRAAFGGVVEFNVRPLGQGVFKQATSGSLVIEDGDHELIAALARLFVQAGFDVRLTRDIQALQWAKLMLNLNNAVSALSGVPTRALLASSGYRHILADLIAEALAVLAKAGIRPARLGALPVQWFPFVLRMPTVLFKVLARAQLKIDPQARSSMWEDLARGRATEVDYLNGEIVRLAEAHGVDAPLNRRIAELVHAAEAGQSGSPKLSAESLHLALFRAQM